MDSTPTDVYNCSSFSNFTQRTTLHGICYVGTDACGKPRRIIWALMLLGISAFFIFNMISLGERFLNYDSYYSIRKTQERSLAYPAVTVCSPYLFNLTALREFSPLGYQYVTNYNNFTSDRANIAKLSNLSAVEQVKHSFSTSDTFVKCGIGTQGNIPCEKYISRTFLDIGLCYTFNGKSVIDHLRASSPGVSQSITLTLDLNSEAGAYIVETSAAFKVVIHDQDEFPNFGNDFVLASPGTTVQVSLQKQVTHNIGTPYSTQECITEVKEITEDQQLLMEYNKVPYSQGLCLIECQLNKITYKDQCKILREEPKQCSVHDWMVNGQQSFNNIQSGNISVPELCSHCLPNCTTVTFLRDTTIAEFPTSEYMSQLQKLRLKYDTLDLIKANLVEVRVFFKTLDVTHSDQKQAVPTSDLYSNVGGLLGLCVGASAVTIFEFCDFAVVWLMAKLYYRKRVINNSDYEVKPMDNPV